MEKAEARRRDSMTGKIIHDILVLLPAESVARFRAVSKSWHTLTTDSFFILSHAVRHGGAPNRTTIASSRTVWADSSSIDFFAVTATGDVGPRMRIPPPNRGEGYYVSLSSCHGMICTLEVGAATKSFHICNILSREWIAVVPIPPYIVSAVLRSFYFHASTGEYRLLTLFWIATSGMGELDLGRSKVEEKLAVTTVGTNTWRYLNNNSVLPPTRERCVTLNGKVHWVSPKEDSICFFDTESEEFHELSLPDTTSGQCWNEVVEIAGRLGLSQVTTPTTTTMSIWELKDYAQEGKWIKRHTISLQGIKEAADVSLLYPFQYVISIDSDKQLLCCRKETDESFALFLYDSKLKELKETPLQGDAFAPFSDYTLISSKFFN